MKKNLLYKGLFMLLFAALANDCLAQHNTYSTKVQKISHSGFYKIPLGPEIVGRCTRYFTDIRIINEQNKQVPYLLRTEPPLYRENNFTELKLVSVKREADKQTHVVIQNIKGKTVTGLVLVVKNNDVSRTVTISGSDDQQQWFVIKEDILLSNLSSDEDDRYIQAVEFPKSAYNYFKIIINGKDLLPINIIKAGIYEDVSHTGKFVENPSPSISQKDSANNSYISVRFAEAYQCDQIVLKVSGTKYYKRKFRVGEANGQMDGNEEEFTLITGDSARFSSDFKSKELNIVIENEDNPALKINSVKTFQLNRYLFAFLDSAGNYRVTFGDSTLSAAKYDIGYFRDSLKNAVPIVQTGTVITLTPDSAKSPENNRQSTILMWVIIAAVLALLLYLTVRMTKEINTKTGSDA